jgi:1-acyl-sn-glycerol-3-phosphate acyltransferase
MAWRLPAVFAMKDFWFFWPVGILMRWLGGIPINRRVRSNTVDQLVQAFDESTKLNMVIPPEGTRKGSGYWKTGFYWIADGAGVPILPAWISYEKKEVGLGEPFYTTGDLAADFERLQDFYEARVGVRGALRPEDLEKAAKRLADAQAAGTEVRTIEVPSAT